MSGAAHVSRAPDCTTDSHVHNYVHVLTRVGLDAECERVNYIIQPDSYENNDFFVVGIFAVIS